MQNSRINNVPSGRRSSLLRPQMSPELPVKAASGQLNRCMRIQSSLSMLKQDKFSCSRLPPSATAYPQLPPLNSAVSVSPPCYDAELGRRL